MVKEKTVAKKPARKPNAVFMAPLTPSTALAHMRQPKGINI